MVGPIAEDRGPRVRGSGSCVDKYWYVICGYATYFGGARSRVEEGERRAADSLAGRGTRAARVRHRQGDRDALRRGAPDRRRLYLCAALTHRIVGMCKG